MKTKMIVGSLAFAFLAFQACTKSDTTEVTSSTSSEATNLKAAVAEVTTTNAVAASSTDVQSLSVQSYTDTSVAKPIGGHHFGKGGGIGPVSFKIPHIDKNATVTVSDSVYPKTITIDYGTGSGDNHGHVKAGKIIITLSDTIINAGSVNTIVYQDFYVDSVKVEYTATLTNKGKNAAGNWVIESKSDQTITKNGEKSVQANQESIEWLSGFGTSDKSDDVFYKSGSGSVTINDTATFVRTITTPLLYDASCRYIKSGVIELTRNGTLTVIDYGTGDCDSSATVTTNGTTETIDLNTYGFNAGGKFDGACPGFGKGDKQRGKGHGKH